MTSNFLNAQNYILGKTEKKKLLSKFFVENNILSLNITGGLAKKYILLFKKEIENFNTNIIIINNLKISIIILLIFFLTSFIYSFFGRVYINFYNTIVIIIPFIIFSFNIIGLLFFLIRIIFIMFMIISLFIFKIITLPFFIILFSFTIIYSLIYTFIFKGTKGYNFLKYKPQTKFFAKFKKLKKNFAKNEFYLVEVKK